MPRPRVFWAHIDSFDNEGKAVWALQTGGRYIGKVVHCAFDVPTETHYRGKRGQPWAVIRGKGVIRRLGPRRYRVTET